MNTSSRDDPTKCKALHPKATAFVRQNLFTGLTAFSELEKRIAALPDERARGDAFEVFTEAYLATQRKHDARGGSGKLDSGLSYSGIWSEYHDQTIEKTA